jgi:hypothetical protein
VANEFYTPSGAPSSHSAGTSASMRAEFASIAAGLDKLPALTGNGGKTLRINAGGTLVETYTPSSVQGIPPMTIVSATTVAMTANTHVALTNAAASSATLPASPAAGDLCWVTVGNGRIDNTIIRNGNNIMSLASDLTLDNAFAAVQLRYVDASHGWVLV